MANNDYGLADDFYERLKGIPDGSRVLEIVSNPSSRERTTDCLFDMLKEEKLGSLMAIDNESKKEWKGVEYNGFYQVILDIFDQRHEKNLEVYFNKENSDVVVFGASKEFVDGNRDLARRLALRVNGLSIDGGIENVIIYPEKLIR